MHELQVHQIELEMQNEELRRARIDLEVSRDEYLDLYELAPVGYFTLTPKSVIAGVNLSGADLLGVERASLIQRKFGAFVTPDDLETWNRHVLSVLKQHGPRSCELALKRADGSLCHVRVESVLRTGIAGGTEIRAAVSDVSERMQAEHELRIGAIAFDTQEGIVITDGDARIQRLNRALCELTGYDTEETIGRMLALLFADQHDEGFHRRLWRLLRRDKSWQGEILCRRKNGEILPVWLTISSVTRPDGHVTNYVATLADITPRREAEAKIHRLAFYDSLTQLPNRRLLLERLQQALVGAARSRRHGAILFIDLDNFKAINDTKGHDVGDLLLIEVARRLSACVRGSDSVSRLGGDEFVVMLEELSEDEKDAAGRAEGVAEKIRDEINKPYSIKNHEYHSTPSIGISLFRDPSDTVDELLKRADVAMYRAKTGGRDTIRFFDPDMQAAVESRAALETELRQALQRDQLELFYQVQVDGARRVTGAEALLRWRHPERGLILPGQFIELAEESGLIVPVGLWVLEAACNQLNAWRGRGPCRDIALAVNVSAVQFRRRDFIAQVRGVLETTGADPRGLKFEFTESLVLDNVAETVEKMRTLKALGVGFSVDDFGTGYSSLSYLKRLPLDQLKIDQSFVHDLETDPSDAVIVQTIIGMARTLGLDVIAEGVETEAQFDFLMRQGCSRFQGYLFSPPVPLAEFERLVAGHPPAPDAGSAPARKQGSRARP